MCFSATASFATAAIAGASGAFALSRKKSWLEVPLAVTPMLFALQQVIEGLIWLDLGRCPVLAPGMNLSLAFLLVAEVVWPIYAPVAVLLIEPGKIRRLLMMSCLAVGLAVSGYLVSILINSTGRAVNIDGHIVYSVRYGSIDLLSIAYLLATGGVIALSSNPTIVAFGVVIITGSIISHFFYWEAFVSVWCFFSAASSVLISSYFWRRPSACR